MILIPRRFVLALAAAPLAVLARVAGAQQTGAAPPSGQPAPTPPPPMPAPPPGSPGAPIAQLYDGLIQVMKSGRTVPFDQREEMLTPVVEQTFNLPVILQATVGLRYASYSPAQQAALLDAFTRFTVATYVANFDIYEGQRFDVIPEVRHVGRDDVVQTRIVPKAGDTTRLDYVMRGAGAAWKAIDVLLDGTISRVAVQRSDFRSLVGTDAGPLITMLKGKVADLKSSAS